MLFRNDIFLLDGVRVRLLDANMEVDRAWGISLDDVYAMPVCLPYSEIQDLPVEPAQEAILHKPSTSQIRYRDRAWARLSPLLDAHGAQLLESAGRKAIICDYAARTGCSPTTLYTHLRRYWQRGQVKQALMPDFHQSGRPVRQGANEVSITAGRGRRPTRGSIYQLTTTDADHFHEVIKREYLKDARHTAVDAFTVLLAEHYRYIDGNGERHLLAEGERPSLRQFRRFLGSHYDIEVRTRAREGDRDFEREHRKVLGSYLADCQGVGHYYEIDATIADVYLVASGDVSKIIGKPTLYLVTDRKSNLIVGAYFGLENASWTGARQAILSIAEDKRALCERYGVAYDPADWPAHQVFPKEFIGDRGEMISSMSNQVADGLEITVTNPPAQRPDWKSTVECGFRQIHSQIRPITPAYDPPSNAERRRGKHYEKDACLTLTDFGKIMLEAIIAHNRREMPGYALSNRELLDGVSPSPLALWAHGIRTRAGLLTRYDAARVRFALLPEAPAVVSERGIEFRGCFYSCPQAISEKWFERARVRRFQVQVSYDPRLADAIYVHPRGEKAGEPLVATLTERSRECRGLCFDEVAYLERLRAEVVRQTDHSRLENSIGLREATKLTIEAAKEKLKGSPRKSRSARRADTVPDRLAERAAERKMLASIEGSGPPPIHAVDSPRGPVPGAHHSPALPAPGADTPVPADSLQARLMAARERMFE
ncbi:Mu transposase C-terminal domain-containing protein [Castellaniella sp.]|uniref:Mu transposase C-terminal domain-containing protein n=1 Tax=Castellaniella sp. TaxID=1955812 RepID=UPI003C7283B3